MVKRLRTSFAGHVLNITLRRILTTERLNAVRLKDVARVLAIASICCSYSYCATTAILRTHHQNQHSERAQHETGQRIFPNPVGVAPQKNTDNQTPDWYPWFWSSAGAEWAIAIIGLVAAYLALQSLGTLQAQARIARRGTFASVKAAGAAKTTAEASLLAERAYIDMSHQQPGLVIEHEGITSDPPEAHNVTVNVAIKNYGKTPGDLLRISLELFEGSELPAVPTYGPFGDFRVVVMPSSTVYHWQLMSIEEEDLVCVQAGTTTLWLIGYVDYRDRFNRFHRSGYARRYITPPVPGTANNLVFVSAPGYNYDIEVDNEGNAKS